MSDIYVKIDPYAIRDEILNSDEALEMCKEEAERLGSETFDKNGCHVIAFKGQQRAHAIAFPNTKENPG